MSETSKDNLIDQLKSENQMLKNELITHKESLKKYRESSLNYILIIIILFLLFLLFSNRILSQFKMFISINDYRRITFDCLAIGCSKNLPNPQFALLSKIYLYYSEDITASIT